MAKIKTFISFDNKHGRHIKDAVANFIDSQYDMQDYSLDYELEYTDNETIRTTIRDNYITDSNVLVLIATKDIAGRKFVDWEIAAAMYDGEKRKDGKRNDINGIVVIDCVKSNIRSIYKPVKDIYDSLTYNSSWTSLSDDEIREKYSYLPARIVDSMVNGADIQVIPYNNYQSLLPEALVQAEKYRFNNKGKYVYTKLKSNNSPRKDF